MSKVNEYLNQSVSHATLRTDHLIDAFAPVLKELDPERYAELKEEIDMHLEILRHPDCDEDEHKASEFLNEVLFDALNDCAPDGYYFGSTEGDGSDFGFWRLEDRDIPLCDDCGDGRTIAMNLVEPSLRLCDDHFIYELKTLLRKGDDGHGDIIGHVRVEALYDRDTGEETGLCAWAISRGGNDGAEA